MNEAEAKRVRAIFDLYLEKGSLVETVREANRRRWTTKRWVTKDGRDRGGDPLDKARLYGLLTNISYVGKIDYDGTIYPGEHEAIVTEAIWQKVQRLLRRNGSAGTRNKYGALLSGLLWCQPCGCAMTHAYSKRGERRYRYYVCARAQKQGWAACPMKSLPAGEIERFVVDRIRSIGTDPKLVAEVVGKARAEVQERADRLAKERRDLERKLVQCAAEVKRVVRAGGSIAVSRLADLQERTTIAEQRLAEVRAEEATLAKERVDEADVAAALKSFDPVWDSLSTREQARIVHLLIERIAYDRPRETVAVTFRPGGIRALAQEVV